VKKRDVEFSAGKGTFRLGECSSESESLLRNPYSLRAKSKKTRKDTKRSGRYSARGIVTNLGEKSQRSDCGDSRTCKLEGLPKRGRR